MEATFTLSEVVVGIVLVVLTFASIFLAACGWPGDDS